MARVDSRVRKAVRIATTPGRVSPGPRVGGRLLDARPDRLDLRDIPYQPPLRSLPAAFPGDAAIAQFLPGYVRAGLVLNQGREGACTGFGLACVVNYLLYVRDGAPERFTGVSPRMLYELARRYDEWPGTDYDGSSCRGALKGWHKHGVCTSDLWPYVLDGDEKPLPARPGPQWERDAVTRPLGVYYRVDTRSVVDLQAAIANIGAVYVSASVHDGWDTVTRSRATQAPENHAGLPVIGPLTDRESLGGHAFALVGYDDRGFIVQNSWGTRWGRGGFAILPYADWVEHGTDAWACALGVPVRVAGVGAPAATTRWRVGKGRALTTIERSRRAAGNPPHDPWPVDHEFLHKPYEPWPTARAYEHTLLSGNDGELVVTDFTRPRSDAPALAREIVHERPRRWFDAHPGTARLVLYAHGGLNGEDESIKRIRVLAPYFESNGIYPLFFTWKTGAGETLGNIVEDWARKLFPDDAVRAEGRFAEARDRAVEATARLLGRGIWSEMRENAALGQVEGHGLDLAARNLASLAQALKSDGRKLELHLVGHSAGGILLGHLLAGLAEIDFAPKVASVTLLAPACSTRFACDRYLSAVERGQLRAADIRIHVLSDENERADGLPAPGKAAYGKSLLYLVSRALDDERKMPLLGMARALDQAYDGDGSQWDAGELETVRRWQAAWPPGNGFVVASRDVRNTRTGGQVQATHGSFDNNIDLLTAVIERIKGGKIEPMEWLDY
jgi:hypothetical protein